MSSLEEIIQNWIVHETNGIIEGRLKKLPEISAISGLTQGKNREVWKFITKHVRSKQSVAFTKKILRLRRARNEENERYPDTNYVILKNKVDDVEDKVRFVEHSTKNISKHLHSLNTLVKNKKEENCILIQKCSMFELATLNLKEKNKTLNIIIDQLLTILNKAFANEKTKCFKNPTEQKSLNNAINEENHIFSDAKIHSIISDMMLIVKKKLLEENCMPVTSLVSPVLEVMSYTLASDLVNVLKNISQQNSKSLQSNTVKAREEKVERFSETYLQSMKLDLIESCFQKKKLNRIECLNELHFKKDADKLQHDYLSLHIKNECLADSIQYLEKKLTSEHAITEKLKENNEKLKSQSQDIEIIMTDFYKRLRALHKLFNLVPQAFSNIKSSLESCRQFLDSELLFTIKCKTDDCFIDVVNKIDCDSKLSFELLKNKEFLKDFLKDDTFTKLNFPAHVLEFLSLDLSQSQYLVIEKLAYIKKKLAIKPNHFYNEPDDISISIAEKMISSVENNTDSLEVVKKNLFEVRKNCKNLQIVLNDWWYQNAQYIPAIEHREKTLKMWLAILDVLE